MHVNSHLPYVGQGVQNVLQVNRTPCACNAGRPGQSLRQIVSDSSAWTCSSRSEKRQHKSGTWSCQCTHMMQEESGRAPPRLHGPVLALCLLD